MTSPRQSFEAVVGAGNVLADDATRTAYATATFEQPHSVRLVVKPASREEVQACVRVANEQGIPLYPISRGGNAGYGSRAPTADQSVILDLSRMNRILEFNEELAYVTVEPGVSFLQLFRFLRERNSSLYLSVTGGPGDGSIIGNIADRGLGSGFYADRHENCCGLEVVLPQGEVIRTGFSRLPGARAAHVHRAGVGPALDGLFIQSNLGIITKLTLWLMPIPESFHTFTFTVKRDEHFRNLIDALRGLLLHRLLRSTYLFLWNDFKQLSGKMRYPFGQTNGATPLPESVRLASRAGDDWGGMGAIYSGSVEQGRAEQKQIEIRLGAAADNLVFKEKTRDEIVSIWSDAARQEDLLKPGIATPYNLVEGILLGIPTNANIATAYWRKPALPAERWAPEKDRCGTFALTLALPFTGGDVAEAVDVIASHYTAAGFEPQMGLSRLKERSLDLISFLVYDRDREGEDERAHTAYRATIKALGDKGYYPCRLSTRSMDALPPSVDDSRQFLEKIRNAIDPNRVIAPGRYDAS